MKDKPLVMVVDDEPLLRELCSRTCRNLLQTNVEAFADAESAFARLRLFPTFDLLLVDYMMPGQDGLSFCQEARQLDNSRKVPIVVLTAAGHSAEAVLKAAGANHVLQKPLTPRLLADALRGYLPAPELVGTIPTAHDIHKEYAASLPAVASSLLALWDQGDHRAAQALLHKLKGTSGTFGLTEIAEAATRVEQALKHGGTLAEQQPSMVALCALLRARGAEAQ